MNEMNGVNAVTDRNVPVVTFVALPGHARAAQLRALVGGRCGPPAGRRPWLLGSAAPPVHRRPRRRLWEGVRSVFGRLVAWHRRRFAGASDVGMSTAEYAVGTVAACGFAALLYKVVTSGAVSGALADLLDRALHAV
ncbi:hypothetical protein ABH930_000512 [Kitasatospora sp. GAS204A]|uniref:DUF4244 domain-containing protein n=1 Tax=unclassified Kitasatospora TaxID=2633591 RepID=UPI00247D245E|nr:hypothetical protein [Kitasatospora sp. GAS204B]